LSAAGVRRCALGGIVGPIAFLAAWCIGGFAASDYSAADDAISHLAEIGAPTRVLMSAGFIVFGVGLAVYAVALRDRLPGPAGIAAAAAGVATLGVAAAPLGRSDAGDTLHGVLASAGYVALALIPLLAAGPLRAAGRTRAAIFSLAVGSVAAISLLATTLGPLDGMFQRLGLTIVDVWIVLSAVAMRSEPTGP
jgi:hypothetical membrane protein